MKAFQKLALVSAIAMTSSAFALEAADDATLAAATGQDGITILVAPGTISEATLTGTYGVSATTAAALDVSGPLGAADNNLKGLTINQVIVHDDDGYGTLGTDATANSGALVIGDGTAADSTVVFADNTTPIRIDIDMVGVATDAAAGNGAMLNVRISTPTLAIKQGAVYVANSDAAPDEFDADGVAQADADVLDNANGSTQTGAIKIMNGMEIVLGATTINVQLGREAQGNMVSVNASIIGGLTINNLETLDQGGAIRGGGIRADSLTIKDSAGANLTANVVADVAADLDGPGPDTFGGLVATIVGLGDAGGANLTLVNQRLGSATSPVMGDIQINGLNLAGTQLIIRGH